MLSLSDAALLPRELMTGAGQRHRRRQRGSHVGILREVGQALTSRCPHPGAYHIGAEVPELLQPPVLVQTSQRARLRRRVLGPASRLLVTCVNNGLAPGQVTVACQCSEPKSESGDSSSSPRVQQEPLHRAARTNGIHLRTTCSRTHHIARKSRACGRRITHHCAVT